MQFIRSNASEFTCSYVKIVTDFLQLFVRICNLLLQAYHLFLQRHLAPELFAFALLEVLHLLNQTVALMSVINKNRKISGYWQCIAIVQSNRCFNNSCRINAFFVRVIDEINYCVGSSSSSNGGDTDRRQAVLF